MQGFLRSARTADPIVAQLAQETQGGQRLSDNNYSMPCALQRKELMADVHRNMPP